MDIISNLPEPVIYHILSFLSPTEALSTSTLSKTWLQIINSFSTNLEFYDKLSPGTALASSVCQTLNRHTADIRSVTLILSYPYEVEHTSPWIQAMEARNVQRVKVSGTHDNSFQQEMEMQWHHYTPTTPPESTATSTSATVKEISGSQA
ncbi:hypothetical protein QQ045_002700 [Rhodiola kirilowii]